jgi:hypothetical protein
VDLEFSGEILYWRGPAPYYFVSVPDDKCVDLHAISKHVSYGWGVIPVEARIGQTVFETSLFPKDGGYLVPLKDVVRQAEGLDEGETVTMRLNVGSRPD